MIDVVTELQKGAYTDRLDDELMKRAADIIIQLYEALEVVDKLWTIDAALSYEEEMKALSPAGLVWQKVKMVLEQAEQRAKMKQ